jgi:hypothetical protein
MNISSFKTFALKPRKLANTFWLWGVLYPWLFVVMFFITFWEINALAWELFSKYGLDYSYELLLFSFYISLFIIEVFFALFLTFRTSKSIAILLIQ